MVSISQRLPEALSRRLVTASDAVLTRRGLEADVAIGGIPFMLATDTNTPQTVETVAVRKDQLDTELDPGEQSLTGWWRRSQSSWHEGAGNLYQESSDTNAAGLGFNDSSGVDVFTPGQMTLLKRMDQGTGTSLGRLRVNTARTSAVGAGALRVAATPGSTFSSFHGPTGKTIIDGLTSGSFFYDVATDGTLYAGAISAPGSATSWPLTISGAGAVGVPSRMGWGKYRLWVIGGNQIWQPDTNSAAGTAQAAVFINPNKGWTYTCLAEGPAAMYFGGHDGTASSIQAVTLDSGGGLPALSGAAVSAALPDGELVQEIAVLAGQYVGIGTTQGFRVGALGANGAISYGPLLIQPPGVVGCTALTTQGRFFVVAFNSSEGPLAYRIDTGTQLGDQLVFPYAKDIVCGTSGYLTSLTAMSSTRLAATDSNGFVWSQSTTNYVPSGWLLTGRIRFRTTEPKLFKYLTVQTQPLDGSVGVELVNDNDRGLTLQSFSGTGSITSTPILLTNTPMQYMSLRFTLIPATTPTAAPTVTSYLIKALPAVTPQRLITLPLLCFDFEQARSGQRYGGIGYGRDRLAALQHLEDLGDTVTFQEFAQAPNGEGSVVTIESVRFVRTVPGGAYSDQGSGGYLIAQLRTTA